MEVVRADGMSLSSAARHLGLSNSRVDQLLRDGTLPFVETELGRLIDREAVELLKVERGKHKVKGINDVLRAA